MVIDPNSTYNQSHTAPGLNLLLRCFPPTVVLLCEGKGKDVLRLFVELDKACVSVWLFDGIQHAPPTTIIKEEYK